MGHLKHLKAEHEHLVDRLNLGTVGLPEPESEHARKGWQELIAILFTPEQAELAVHLPVIPAGLSTIAKRAGLSESDCEARLEAMANKGLVMDLVHPKSGKTKYLLAPPVIGFFEFSLMRASDDLANHLPQQEVSEAMEAYIHGDPTFAREAFGKTTMLGRALLDEHYMQEEDLPDVLDWERCNSIIEEAESLAVSFCYCRHKKEHLGTACDAPMEVCLSMNGGADFVLRRKFGRPIDKQEALNIIATSRQKGLVQIADNVQDRPSYICNCCGCCCGQLSAINEYGLNAVTPSGFQPTIQMDHCKGCSRCARACPIGAIEMTPRREQGQRKNRMIPELNTHRCIGCGLCAQACKPQKGLQALNMARLSSPPQIPRNSVEKALRQALERGRLPHLLIDQGKGRGFRFLNKALQILTALPPVEKALANQQLQSRFVNYFLQRKVKGFRPKGGSTSAEH